MFSYFYTFNETKTVFNTLVKTQKVLLNSAYNQYKPKAKYSLQRPEKTFNATT